MKKKKQRRSGMDVAAALLRCALACSGFILLAGALTVSGVMRSLPDWATMLIRTAMTLLCFGLPAVRGLFVVDGDQSERIGMQALGAEQLFSFSLTGVLLVCPMTLMNDLLLALIARFTPVETAAQAPAFALFLPMLLQSVIVAPVCEEMFFRGYLQSAFRESGVRQMAAAAMAALFFALVHGMNAAAPLKFVMGLLLSLLAWRAGSILAPIVVHAAYNLTLLLLSFLGMGGLFSGLGFVSCLIRLLGCAAFSAVLMRAYCARRTYKPFVFGRRMTLRQSLTLSFALAALAYIPVVLYVI